MLLDDIYLVFHSPLYKLLSIKYSAVDSLLMTRFCLLFSFQLMAAMGNAAAKAKYEQKVPAFYYRPTHTDCK